MNNRTSARLTGGLFAIYCLLLIWIILFKLSFSIADLDRVRQINLIPFHYDDAVDFQLSEVLQNFIIFIPFGIYLKMLGQTTPKTILYGLAFSLLLEIAQFALKAGRSDITDLITNTLGTAAGAYLHLLLGKIFHDEAAVNRVLSILAGIATVLFVLLLAILLLSN